MRVDVRQAARRAVVIPVLGLVVSLVGAGAAAADPFGQPRPIVGGPLVGARSHHSPWQELPHQPPFAPIQGFGPGSMFLMSDGSVLVHQDDTRNWKRLVPDRHGSYLHGHWLSVARLPGGYAPLYFTSAVLPDGRLALVGGEYDGGSEQVETNQGAIYDPGTKSWQALPAPLGWSSVGDAQSTVLTNGRLVVGRAETDQEAVLDPATLTWSPTGTGKQDANAEEGFSLLPDGRVLTVDTANRGSELLDPTTGARGRGSRYSSSGPKTNRVRSSPGPTDRCSPSAGPVTPPFTIQPPAGPALGLLVRRCRGCSAIRWSRPTRPVRACLMAAFYLT